MGLTNFLINYFTLIISKLGYVGVGVLMTMESMVLPVPSEAVMPFAGFLWYDGKLSLWLIVLASTIGSIIGSCLSYYIGAYGGRPFIKKWGRYLLLNEHHLEKTEQFFKRNGEKTIFISRFIPVVRHLISLPAGIGRMKIWKFLLYTTIGAGMWNAFLTWLGFQLRDKWEIIRRYSEVLDIIIIIMIIGGIVYFIYKRLKKTKSNDQHERHERNIE
jgi:membrane protein DedA with SNARE-associated domain